MRRFPFLLLTFLLLPLLMAHPAAAQGTGGIRGTVVDRDDSPIVGATVTVINPDLHVNLRGETDAGGEFRIDSLSPGKGYTLTVSFPRMGTISQPQIEVPANKVIAVPICLRPSDEWTAVTLVTGWTPGDEAGKRDVDDDPGLAPPAAQRPSGLRLFVVDKEGVLRSGVTVAVTNPGLGITAGGVTDTSGEFSAPLPPGKGYTLSASYPETGT